MAQEDWWVSPTHASGIQVQCMSQNFRGELSVDLLMAVLDDLAKAWPYRQLLQLDRIVFQSTQRPDRRQEFITNPKTAAIYDRGRRAIYINQDRWMENPWGILFHEWGHFLGDNLLVFLNQDYIGTRVAELNAFIAGPVPTGSSVIEEWASNVGRVLMRRVGRSTEATPKGFENLLEFLRQVRA